jgi:hypothetical protein
MNPKTFRIMIYQPYGPETWSLVSKNMYSFNIHASDLDEATNWVARIFPGIDVHQKSDRNYKVGCADPVHIIDCDAIKKYGFVDGKRVPIKTPEGYYRRTPKEIARGLFRIISTINKDYTECLRIADYSSRMYEKFKLDHYRDRAAVAKKAAQLASPWIANLMTEYITIQRNIASSIEVIESAHEHERDRI